MDNPEKNWHLRVYKTKKTKSTICVGYQLPLYSSKHKKHKQDMSPPTNNRR